MDIPMLEESENLPFLHLFSCVWAYNGLVSVDLFTNSTEVNANLFQKLSDSEIMFYHFSEIT